MWTRLFTTAESGKYPPRTSPKQYIDEGLQFIAHLTAHHNIEETYLFPLLARKMPEFRSNHFPLPMTATGKDQNDKNRQAALLLQQHKDIHDGMDDLEIYLGTCKAGEAELEMSVVKDKMDTWGVVLWDHLNLEVQTLGADNMRKYWTLEEIRRIPM